MPVWVLLKLSGFPDDRTQGRGSLPAPPLCYSPITFSSFSTLAFRLASP